MRGAVVLLLAVVVLATAVNAHTERAYQTMFTSFMAKYGKQYPSNEMFTRFQLFRSAVDLIDAHNARGPSYTMAVNQFADMTDAEYRSYASGARAAAAFASIRAPITSPAPHDNVVPANDVDWRKSGVVTPVESQGQCGSTWAWGPVMSLEVTWAQANKNVATPLSVSQVNDCETETSQGCNGGDPNGAFAYVLRKGLCTEADYPYKDITQQCMDSKCKPFARFTSVVKVALNETAMAAAVSLTALSLTLDVDCDSFRYYQSGILDSSDCSSDVDHCVTAVGYGTDAGKDYWIMKNSWGNTWGDAGYIRLVRGKNQCNMMGAGPFVPSYGVV